MALNSSQSLSDAQIALLDSVKPPEAWLAPNAPLLPSPFMWNNSYTNPAWNGSYPSGGAYNSAYFSSNQFNSALTQPSNPLADFLGKEVKPVTDRRAGISSQDANHERHEHSKPMKGKGKKKYKNKAQ